MAATVDTHKGGRIRIHVSGLTSNSSTAALNSTNILTYDYFSIPYGFRIEYAYIVLTSDIPVGSEQGIGFYLRDYVDGASDVTAAFPTLTPILKVDKYFIGPGTSGSFYDITPHINIRTFCVSTTATTHIDANVAIVTYNAGGNLPGGTPNYKLIIGLEAIL